MTCEEYKPLLSGRLDGELSPEEEIRLKNHLSACSDCRRELLQFQEMKEVTDAVKPIDLPDRFWDTYWSGIYNRLERSVRDSSANASS
jgi:anti-sigma factor RsiW